VRPRDGGLGVELPTGSRNTAPGQGGAKPPVAETLFGCSMKAANLPTFLKFENVKTLYTICVVFANK